MTTKTPIKFNLNNVVNTETGAKARVNYSTGPVFDPKDKGTHPTKRTLVPCVTIYAKDFGNVLAPVFGDLAMVRNDTEIQTDYVEKDRVRLFTDHPLYAAAKEAADRKEAQRVARRGGAL
jgi:hypothetical protein